MSRDPNRTRSRPDFGDRAGEWTVEPTPTSLRRMAQSKDQEQERRQETYQARRERDRRKPVRTEPTAEEKAKARELHRAGLVRTPEENQRRRTGLDRRMLQNHGTPWLPPEDEDEDEIDTRGRT